MAREQDGEFKSLNDFCERVEGLSKRLLENLIKVGALDGFGLRRSQLLAICDDALAAAQQTQKDRKLGQGSLFDLMAPEDRQSSELSIPELPEWEIRELLAYEKELLGFYVSGHPIAEAQELIDLYQLDDLSDLGQLPDGSVVRVGAYLAGIERKNGKKDNRPWAILQLENRESSLEALLFSDHYAETMVSNPSSLQPETIVFVEGELSRREPEEMVKIMATRVIPAQQAAEVYTGEIHLRIHERLLDEQKLQALKQLCQENPGKTPVIFCLLCQNRDVVFTSGEQVNISFDENFRNQVQAWFGPECLHPKASKIRPEGRRQAWKNGRKRSFDN